MAFRGMWACLPLLAVGASAGSFETDVRPILSHTCQMCHNAQLATGNFDITPLLSPESLSADRDVWDRVVARVRGGEMPPKGVPRPPPEQITALLTTLEAEFDRVDRAAKHDPGRVTAHRLNRAEYANTIRDLLGVDFRATEEFPADDSGYGFDNIGDVLTVSPALMQKYLSVAERIASRAVGGDPLPKGGVFSRKDRVRRIDAGVIVLNEILEYDADYVVRVNLVGHRGPKDEPVTLAISVDGNPLKTVTVPVQISAVNQQGGATQRSSQEARVFLPGNQHTLQAAFVNDTALHDIPQNMRLNPNRNIFPESIELVGPFAPAQPHRVTHPILLCDPASGAACVDRILTALCHRAFRRPVSRTEVGALLRIFDRARSKGYPPAQSLQFAISAMLVSPQFLFRIERDPKPGTIGRISDIELASRLSYFLWSSMPDDELLRLGETNQLHQPDVLEAQVKRLLADPKSSAFADNFAGQWLETRSLEAMKPDAKKFPEWTPELKEAMRTETQKFFQAVVREDRSISDFIDGRYTFLNEQLARHYGIENVSGPDFRRVELTGGQRSGVFTQASVLTVSSYPTRTSIVLRGKYLLENVLNAAPPPPPPVPSLNEEAVGVAGTLRQQMEIHRSDPSCAACHAKMDQLGFALENYDAIGRWRSEDGKFKVDPSGALPGGKTFSGPAEMKALLVESLPEFARALASKMLTYALGRGVETYDRIAVQNLVRQSAAQGYRIQSLILGIVYSAPFQERRGETKSVQEVASR